MQTTKQYIIYIVLMILLLTTVSAIDITDCTNFVFENSSNTYYLINNVTQNSYTGFSNNGCMAFSDFIQDVVLDCQGYNINYYNVTHTPTITVLNGHNITVRNCAINTTDARAFTLANTGTYDILIENNDILGQEGISMINGANNVIVQNNSIVIDTPDAGIILATNNDNITIRNNFIDKGGFGFVMDSGDLSSSENIFIYNNNFSMEIGGRGLELRDNSGNGSCPINLQVYNNSFDKQPFEDNILCDGNNYFELSKDNYYGNYWESYTSCTDLGNGWCNDSYIHSDAIEHYPLANPDRSVSCEADWQCGSWNACVNSSQTCNTTFDDNSCLDFRTYPLLTQGCVSCNESWIADLDSCLINDTQLLTYHDENACGTTVMLPPQNGTYVACNYCTISYHSEQTACLNETITTYYVNDNFGSCCNMTSIPADCDLPSNSTVSCATGDSSLITGLVIDTSVEVGRVWVGFAGLIAMLGIAGWVMFII